MDRTACVDVPALPLQVLLQDEPAWRDGPAAVVDRDAPTGTLQWVNEAARDCRILPGMRFAAALSLSDALHAGAVSDARIGAAVRDVTRRLWRFSPRVEPAPREPGVFWLDAGGLQRLYPSLGEWAKSIGEDLRAHGFDVRVAVGFTRFGSYAAAKAGANVTVFASPEQERARIRKVPIDRLGFDPRLRETLSKLGIHDLGGFLDLPAAGIRRRLGVEAAEWHALARGEGWTPLMPLPPEVPAMEETLLDYPESDLERLMVLIAPMLQAVVDTLVDRYERLAALHLQLLLDDGKREEARLAPATPTNDTKQLLLLIRLRLEALPLSAGVVELMLRGDGVGTAERQLDLLHETRGRDNEAVHRAFAKIRAELGDDAVVRARLCEGHLPEACFEWERFENLRPSKAAPRIDAVEPRPLVRRIYTPPVALPPRPSHEPDGWLVAGLGDGPVEEKLGPYIVSGGWWAREVSRAYYYARTRRGRLMWLYHDQKRRRWFLQGEVE